MAINLSADWEHNAPLYGKIPKAEFDNFYRRKQFKSGPLQAKPSKWMREFGPYDPKRPAFGILKDGRKVWCDTAETTEPAKGT